MKLEYCTDFNGYSRIKTAEVKAGDLGIGGDNPIRIQSMCNTDTIDTESSVRQALALAEAGCEMVRLAVPSLKAAESLADIHRQVRASGCSIPLSADVHFQPAAALRAAEIVEKVRINPGNYSGVKKFRKAEYSESEYQHEMEKAFADFKPLLHTCRTNGTALRIGVNHGSLSDRIVSRYGDTPEGMVESALEFLSFCRELDFHQVVISMKSSNTRQMVTACRLLMSRMLKLGRVYPLHLGVTEAGSGSDGIIKSAIGIGALLADGIGDTIRVSLTGNPVAEIAAARDIISYYNAESSRHHHIGALDADDFDPLNFSRRVSDTIGIFGGDNVPRVVTPKKSAVVSSEGQGPDLAAGDEDAAGQYRFKILTVKDMAGLNEAGSGTVLILQPEEDESSKTIRIAVLDARARGIKAPILSGLPSSTVSGEDLDINISCFLSILLIDGLVDGIWLEKAEQETLSIVFTALQASRLRITRMEFISCPTCARTIFDIEKTAAEVMSMTSHLTGLKIAVMGCIVNGPGEMADADFGCVGSGRGKVDLYRGNEAVRKNIPEAQAVEALVELIKENGKWREPGE